VRETEAPVSSLITAGGDLSHDPLPERRCMGTKADAGMTLADVPRNFFRVEGDRSVQEIHDAFDADPSLPGVIVSEAGRFVGMVPRMAMLELLGRPFGVELFMRRPITHLLATSGAEVLMLNDSTPVPEAARRALERPQARLFDPLVVIGTDGKLALVDVQLLLVTLTRLLEKRNRENETLLAESQERAVELQATLEELRRTQDDLVQASKMSSLAQLVAGVAHEVNTPIGVAVTAASHLNEKTAELAALFQANSMKRSDLGAYLLMAEETSRVLNANLARAAELIRGFKLVATDQTSHERRRFLLGEYLASILFSLRPQLKKARHEVTVSCDPSLEMYSLPGAIAQVLTNLVMNAIVHAFDGLERPGHMTLNAKADGEWVEMCFADDGKGIPPENLSHVFEPFFTTRRGRGGSGLGLHIAFNLVTWQLGGKIACTSTPGEGAVFTIRLPRHLPVECKNGNP